jgi:beta-glucosidase
MQDRANDIVSRLTLDEKVAQMQMDAPAIDRLGIPAYHWWNEALHGVARNGTATVFPQSIGLAATFNSDLIHHLAQTIAVEARAKHHEALRHDIHAINTGLDLWCPNINIFRDPRWGRGQETYGEDPFLTSRLAVAYIQGLQGDDPNYFMTIATPKHFAVHSGPELERHRIDMHISDHDLFDTYLPAFEVAIREGHAYSIMGAYNSLDGTPCCANSRLLNDILRKDWGFDGYVVSDVGAIDDIYVNHQYAGSYEQAAALAVKAGCDLDGGEVYSHLPGAIAAGLITEKEIDRSVTRLMLARLRLGEFDPPRRAPSFTKIPLSANDSPEHDALAREAARQSIVLLKNDHNQLPLKTDLKTIAVIGPTADNLAVLTSSYNGTPSHPVTILQGIRNAVPPTTRVIYEQGCPLVAEQLPLEEPVPAACLFSDDTLKFPGLKADYYKDANLAGRPARTRIDAAPNFDWSLETPPLKDSFSATWTGTLVPPVTGDYQLGITATGGYRLFLDDKPVFSTWVQGAHRTTSERIHLEQNHPVHLRVEYFYKSDKNNAAIQLRWTRPDAEPFYADAVRAAEKADQVILVLGLTAGLEREQATSGYKGFEGGDRQTLDLPAPQQQLLEALAKTNKPITLVLTSGSALSINWANESEQIPAILEAWYPGQQGGNAVADVLFGKFNPSGKLPITFYKSVSDLPPFENYSIQNRTYRYFKGEPLYPFGHGLSYTTFETSAPKILTPNPTTTDNLQVQLTIKNIGTREGDEVAQLYISHPNIPTAPQRSLQSFQKVHLQPSEQKIITFTLTPYQLATINEKGERQNLPGPVTLETSSTGAGPAKTITLTGNAMPPTYPNPFPLPVVK